MRLARCLHYRKNLIDGCAEQANPIVGRFPRQRWHVAVHVVNFRATVTAVKCIPSVVADCAPV